jgi:hypothetical protein
MGIAADPEAKRQWIEAAHEKNGETYRCGLDAVVFNKKK